MANIGYFEIPADNVDRAKHFYHGLLGWKIAPTKTPMDSEVTKTMEYQGHRPRGRKGSHHEHGRDVQAPDGGGIMDYVVVDDIDKVLAKVEKLGGKIIRPKMEIPSVGIIAIIADTEENGIGLWKPAMGMM